MGRREVARNQRARIHGGMIEAVARRGYEQASVKQVITLAGVSRRSFYEQFANKGDCFLATFELIAARELRSVRSAYLSSSGDLDARLRALLAGRLDAARRDPKAAHLLLLDVLAAGEEGLVRRCRASATQEQLLGECFARPPRGSALSGPLLRLLTGGIEGSIAAGLDRTGKGPGLPALEPLLEWTLAVRCGAKAGLSEWLSRRLRERTREISLAAAAAGRASRAGNGNGAGHRNGGANGNGAGHGNGSSRGSGADGSPATRPEAPGREEILETTLRLAGRHGHHELTVPHIADATGIPVDTLLAQFSTPAACMSAAHKMLGEQLARIAGDPRLREPGWEQALPGVVSALLAHLAANPLHTRALVQSVWCLGPESTGESFALTAHLAAQLTPGEGRPAAAAEAATTAALHGLWHTARCLIAARRVQLLPALTDHLSFLLLAPAVGPAEALALLRG